MHNHLSIRKINSHLLLDEQPRPRSFVSILPPPRTPTIMSNPVVFFDMTIGGAAAGRIEMTLRADVVPKTAEVHRCLHI